MVNSSSEVVCPLLQGKKKDGRQSHAAAYFTATALCGCVMLQSLMCDIDPLPLNQTPVCDWRREASERTDICRIETLRTSTYYRSVVYRKEKSICLIFLSCLSGSSIFRILDIVFTLTFYTEVMGTILFCCKCKLNEAHGSPWFSPFSVSYCGE